MTITIDGISTMTITIDGISTMTITIDGISTMTCYPYSNFFRFKVLTAFEKCQSLNISFLQRFPTQINLPSMYVSMN